MSVFCLLEQQPTGGVRCLPLSSNGEAPDGTAAEVATPTTPSSQDASESVRLKLDMNVANRFIQRGLRIRTCLGAYSRLWRSEETHCGVVHVRHQELGRSLVSSRSSKMPSDPGPLLRHCNTAHPMSQPQLRLQPAEPLPPSIPIDRSYYDVAFVFSSRPTILRPSTHPAQSRSATLAAGCLAIGSVHATPCLLSCDEGTID